MANIRYIINQLLSTDTPDVDFVTDQEKQLIDQFSINSSFDQTKHRVILNVYSVDDILLDTDTNYTNYRQDALSAGAGKAGASNLAIDPEKDILLYGYDTGDVRFKYSFYNNLFSNSKIGGNLFITEISSDRTEIRATSNELTTTQLQQASLSLKNKLDSESYFSEFILNFDSGESVTGLNIQYESTLEGVVAIKLYEPLPDSLNTNSIFNVEEKVADSVTFEIIAEIDEDEIKVPYLKGPNFNLEVNEKENTPTEYFNFNELFSFPVTSSYYELRSLFNEKSAEIAINHSKYSDFIHFSSAEERLRNFKYKLDLIQSYESSISSIDTTNNTTTAISGSKEYYKNLIDGIVTNFDHYDRYLYYESSSTAWPKASSDKPFINLSSTESEAVTWFADQLVIASNYDNTNFDILTNTIPTYIREDSNNEPYVMFIHMIAQHFDNLWIYFKAVSDKYDADNRLNFGISKDLVRSAVESFGVKLYSSNQNTGNLFQLLSGQTLQTGSELITSQSIATSGSFVNLQPISQDNYQKEVYKRIYHNLPHLLKTKGTQRGLRALINCFGIPSDILSIKQFGGAYQTTPKYLGAQTYTTESLDKIRLDNTGSLISGSTLSPYVSTVYPVQKTSDDIHTIEVGFSISDLVDRYIKTRISSSFNIDNYIGDPHIRYESEYEELNTFGTKITRNTINWEDIVHLWEDADWNWDNRLLYYRDPFSFIRLVRFFDNSIFRTIKDFVPARSNVNTGVIIKSHFLHRNKAKQVVVTPSLHNYTGSIELVEYTGSHGGSYDTKSTVPYSTNYNTTIVTPIGKAPLNITDESPKYTGELSGSNIRISVHGELNDENTFKKANQPQITFNINVFNISDPIPAFCTIDFTGSYVGDIYTFTAVGNGTVAITYPTTVTATSGSIEYVNSFNQYAFITATAQATYYPGGTFDGWYTDAVAGTLISTDSTISIYYTDETIYGNSYYARFS